MHTEQPSIKCLRVLRLLALAESYDAAAFSQCFAEQALFRFGDEPPCTDRPEIRAFITALCESHQALYHDIKVLQDHGDGALIEMDVHTWAPDGEHAVRPCVGMTRQQGNHFLEFKLLFLERANGSKGCASGSPAERPSGMRSFFRAHPLGLAMVAAGHTPRWSVAGPHWPLDMPRLAYAGSSNSVHA